MLEQKQLLWRPIERKCLDLLQRDTARKDLLQIHAFMLRNAIETNVNLLTKFISVCASLSTSSKKRVGISYARKVFDERPQRDETFICNSMIRAYLGMQQFKEGFTLYKDLRRNTCFNPDKFTFTALAKSCGLNMSAREGFEIHSHVIKNGLCLDLYVSTAIVDMYSKFGNITSAHKMFDEMQERSQVSWTALICGYARIGDMTHAKKLFDEMTETKDTVIYNAMIDGYVKSRDMNSARSLFNEMPDRNVISWTSMVDGYCNNGDIISAGSLFEAMPVKNVYSWNAMIGGHCRNKKPHEAIRLFREMQSSASFEPDKVTIVSILPAIADLGALELGEEIHRSVKMKELDRASNVQTALIDMYAKCGEITKAKKIFDEMSEKETASWNAIINGFAVNGHALQALEVFREMQNDGVNPDDITMLGVLSACNHGGFVEQGKKFFKEMEEFGLTKKIEHYGCMVDLLGRAGFVKEAERLMKEMPYEPNCVIMSSFLSACGYLNDVKRAENVMDKAVEMEPCNDGNYVVLRNLYAAEKRWKDVEEVKWLMKRNGAKKDVGSSVIKIDC